MARIAMAWLALVMVAGCSLTSVLEPRKDPTRFYVLAPMDASSRAVPLIYSAGGASKVIAIGLGPVKFPAYLAREEIVTHSTANRVDVSDIDQWAEPLDKNFVSVLAQNLTILLGAQVKTFPWYRTALDYQIALDVERFDTDSAGTAIIIGRWEIENPATGEQLNSGEINISETARSGENSAATLSRATGDLSTQLADAIRALKPPASAPKMD
jgi:uncharacterized lipoprotein YmbA